MNNTTNQWKPIASAPRDGTSFLMRLVRPEITEHWTASYDPPVQTETPDGTEYDGHMWILNDDAQHLIVDDEDSGYEWIEHLHEHDHITHWTLPYREDIKVIIFYDQDTWLAQCLDIDIASQGDTIDEVVTRMVNNITIYADIRHTDTPLKQAPQRFWDMFDDSTHWVNKCFKLSPYKTLEVKLCATLIGE